MTSRLTVIITLIILSGFILCGCCCCAIAEDQTLINSGLEFLSAGKVWIVGSGEITTKEYDSFGFDALAVSDAFKATIKQGEDFSVVVRTDEGVMPHVEVVKSGNTLRIGILEERYSLSNVKMMQVEITMPELSALRLSGASNATISGFSSSSDLELDVSGASTLRIEDITSGYGRINVSGASNIKLTGFNFERDLDVTISGASYFSGDLQAGDTRFKTSGASHATLSGSGVDLVVDASGASVVDLSEYLVYNATIEASGESNVTVNPSGELNAEASGESNIFYEGSPRLAEIDLDESSNLRKK